MNHKKSLETCFSGVHMMKLLSATPSCRQKFHRVYRALDQNVNNWVLTTEDGKQQGVFLNITGPQLDFFFPFKFPK